MPEPNLNQGRSRDDLQIWMGPVRWDFLVGTAGHGSRMTARGLGPRSLNDDEEFVLLTSRDELLLRILHDPRPCAGIIADEAIALVVRIVEGQRPGI